MAAFDPNNMLTALLGYLRSSNDPLGETARANSRPMGLTPDDKWDSMFSEDRRQQRIAQVQKNQTYGGFVPATVDSQVTNTGVSAPNVRGEQVIQTPAGPETHVNPQQDRTMTPLAAGDNLLPPDATNGFVAPAQYAGPGGNQVAYATNRAPRPPTFQNNRPVEVPQANPLDIFASLFGGPQSQDPLMQLQLNNPAPFTSSAQPYANMFRF